MTENYIWGLVVMFSVGFLGLLVALFVGVDRSGEKHRKH